MPSKRITDAFVRTVKPPKKEAKHRQVSYIDTMERGLALVLVVSYGGTRTFRVLTYSSGKAKSRKLGAYPAMSVKDARAEAREYWQNPKKFEAQANIGTFKDIAESWIKRHVDGNKLRSKPEIERILTKYVYPKWKDRAFLEITRREVNDLLDEVVDNHGRSQADAVLAQVRAVMTWFQSRDENYTSPIVRGMRRNKNRKARDRVLSDDEIRALWKASDGSGAFGAILKVLLLTAQRREKVARMQWGDITDGTWTIAADDREKGTVGKVALPQGVIEILEKQPRLAGNPHVFHGSRRGRRRSKNTLTIPPAFNSWSQRKQELDDHLPGMKPWTIHDLRRTARSLMSRAGVRPDIAERVLGHAIPGVEGVYDRHQYDEEKADALRRLAALIEGIVNPAQPNVIPMTKAS